MLSFFIYDFVPQFNYKYKDKSKIYVIVYIKSNYGCFATGYENPDFYLYYINLHSFE